MIGKTISHYKIIEKLGTGGMGEVYRAEDLKLLRTVALKFLPSDLTGDEEAKSRFINEAQAASSLQHNNICTIHEIDETDDGKMFIVMDCYEGETLKEKIGNEKIEIEKAIGIIRQIAEGLEKAHENGIVHRDIKPANIFITKDGVVKILDFGLAKARGHTQMTQIGTTLGTVSYMSPEQASGNIIDKRTDIWSLGVVMYEMLTGELPFKSEYEQAIIYSILNDDPNPVKSLRANVPESLEKIIDRCLLKNIDDRYQNISDLLDDLAAHTGSQNKAAKKRKLLRIQLQNKTYAYGFGFALLIIIALWYFLIMQDNNTHDQKSIAVLPFTNLSVNKEDEFFSDGITEDILMQLSKIKDLRVISRTSVMQYKDTKKSIREIGKELNVAAILEGSIRRANNQVRIVAQLIDAKNDEHIWAESYDKNFEQIFEIQSDVAKKIAQALQAKLSFVEKQRIEKTPTENLSAYEYNLRGRNYYYRYTSADNDKAIELFKYATVLDSNYAIAWAGLGDAYAQKFGRFSSSMNWLDSAINAGNKAIKIDSNSAEGFKALGTAYIYKGLKKNSFEVLHKAIERNPNYYPAIANLGITYDEAGELVEALYWLKKTIALNPVDIVAYSEIGETYRRLNEFQKAEYWFNKSIKVQPDYAQTYPYLALQYLEQNKTNEVKEQIKKMHTYAPDDFIILEQAEKINLILGNFSDTKEYFQSAIKANPSLENYYRSISGICLAYIFKREGKNQEAENLLDKALNCRLKEVSEGGELMEMVYSIAGIYAIRNNKEESLKWLQKAINSGWRDYHTTERDPWFENVRGNEKFKTIMIQLKNRVEQMRNKVKEAESWEESKT